MPENKKSYDISFDKDFAQSKNIRFYPFVGCGYLKSKVKIMVLGESHYGRPEEIEKDFTREIVLAYNYLEGSAYGGKTTDQKPWIKNFKRTAAMLTGGAYLDSDWIWHKLAFANFSQGMADASKKTSMDNDLLEISRKAFLDIIGILKPDLVIAWGITYLKNWLPQDDKQAIKGRDDLYFYGKIQGSKIWHICHPSHGFSSGKWHEQFKEVLEVLGLKFSDIP